MSSSYTWCYAPPELCWSKSIFHYREQHWLLLWVIKFSCQHWSSFPSLTFVLNHHHHHHDVQLARISLTLSLHVSLSFIAFSRSSGLHPISSHSCCINVRAGRLAFDWPYARVHRGTSLTISSLLLQQCPACLDFSLNICAIFKLPM